MATEQDLKFARAEFDAAFKKAKMKGDAFVLGQLRSMTLADLDELPISQQIEELLDAASRFMDYAAGKDDLSDMSET